MVYNESRRLNKNVKFKKEAENIKNKLERSINSHKIGEGKDGTINQLENIYKEIELMVESLNYIPTSMLVPSDVHGEVRHIGCASLI